MLDDALSSNLSASIRFRVIGGAFLNAPSLVLFGRAKTFVVRPDSTRVFSLTVGEARSVQPRLEEMIEDGHLAIVTGQTR